MDLVIDRVYEGGRKGHAGDDPISKLVGVSNQGGFRPLVATGGSLKLLVLFSSFADADWPDHVDLQTGRLTYFGDNKKPGHGLLETARGGNRILDRLFAMAHGENDERRCVPPILVFATTGAYRDVRFIGLAVPGAEGLTSNDDLVAVWRSTGGARFQNYKAAFTILNVPALSRDWLDEIKAGNAFTSAAPKAWRDWIARHSYDPLVAKPTKDWRKKSEQLPRNGQECDIVARLHKAFRDRPTDFEHCAAALVRLMDDRFENIVVTRPSRDGGRDATGEYRIARGPAEVRVEFALEAKCYALGNPVGVKEASRLISRLKHRQFGLLITTSYVAEQAYKEIVEDGHPIGVLAAIDIARLLIAKGYGDREALNGWISSARPSAQSLGGRLPRDQASARETTRR